MERRSADFDDNEKQEDEDAGRSQRLVLAVAVRMIFVCRLP
jgi:hypothetical protein